MSPWWVLCVLRYRVCRISIDIHLLGQPWTAKVCCPTSYFKSEGLSDARFKQLETAFNDRLTELHLLFYQAVLPVFTTFNKMLQSEEPLIYLLYKRQQRFMNKLASKFVKPDTIRSLKEANKSFSELDISTENQKEGKNLFIGFTTRNKLSD